MMKIQPPRMSRAPWGLLCNSPDCREQEWGLPTCFTRGELGPIQYIFVFTDYFKPTYKQKPYISYMYYISYISYILNTQNNDVIISQIQTIQATCHNLHTHLHHSSPTHPTIHSIASYHPSHSNVSTRNDVNKKKSSRSKTFGDHLGEKDIGHIWIVSQNINCLGVVPYNNPKQDRAINWLIQHEVDMELRFIYFLILNEFLKGFKIRDGQKIVLVLQITNMRKWRSFNMVEQQLQLLIKPHIEYHRPGEILLDLAGGAGSYSMQFLFLHNCAALPKVHG